ncbi:MAG: hypothetical protein FWD57_07020 [Polyangiaceae bacterium]|nr:hypothetical protein [Polyangiaceae bacterium]
MRSPCCNKFTPTLLSLVIAALTTTMLLAGCSSPFKTAVRNAKDAESAGDTLAAAEYYSEACEQKPSDYAICAKAKRLSKEEHARVLQTIRRACEAGDVSRCILRLREVEELNPNAPETMELMERCGEAFAQKCESDTTSQPANHPIEIAYRHLFHIRCLESAKLIQELPGYSNIVKKNRAKAAKSFSDIVDNSVEDNLPGTAYTLLAASNCLSPRTETIRRRQQSRSVFLNENTTPISVQVVAEGVNRKVNINQLCSNGTLPLGTRCASARPARYPLIEVHFDIELEQPVHTTVVNHTSKRYVSHYVTVPNEAYTNRRDRLESLDQLSESMSDLGDEARRDCRDNDQSTCRAADVANAVSAAASAVRIVETFRPEPRRTRQEPVYGTFEYAITQHTWTADYAVEITTIDPSGTKKTQRIGRLTYKDTEHPGFAAADVPQNPLKPPSRTHFDQKMKEWAIAQLASTVSRLQTRRASAHLAACAKLTDTLERHNCETEAALIGGVDPGSPEDVLKRASAEADQLFGERDWPVPECLSGQSTQEN